MSAHNGLKNKRCGLRTCLWGKLRSFATPELIHTFAVWQSLRNSALWLARHCVPKPDDFTLLCMLSAQRRPSLTWCQELNCMPQLDIATA